MSDFLRKASLKVKGSNHDLAGTANGKPSTFQSRPSTSRSASTASSIISTTESESVRPKPTRRPSAFKKGKKRLASLFSSSNLHADSEKPLPSPSALNSTEPSPLSSPVRPSTIVQTPSSASTSTLGRNGAPAYSRLGIKRTPSTGAEGVSTDLGKLDIGSATNGQESTGSHLTESPLAATPASGLPGGGLAGRKRAESTFSQYDLEGDSDSDDDVFLTPSEGLSEIGEGDEEDTTVATAVPVNVAATKGALSARTNAHASPIGDKALDASNVPKGSESKTDDVFGTGPSTLRRSKAEVAETKVKARALTKADVLSIDQSAVLAADVDVTRQLLQLFLRSRMREAEDMCAQQDPDGVHLYMQVAYCIFQALKGMMTFDAADLATALEISKNVQIMATTLRKPSDGLMSRFGSLVKTGAGIQRFKTMTVMERHAELVFAESSLFKALLAIIAGGDWLGMIREALSMRAAWGLYRTMQQYIEDADKNGYDDDIDMDFRSGVALGAGTSSLMLSLLPGKVLKIAEVLGYGGDRDVAMRVLYSAGGWSSDSETPIHDEHNEGLRRPVVDLILLTFHLVISLLMPISGVDIPMARKILNYNMRIYPDGIFFLYFQARLRTAECDPARANESLQKAMDLKLEYVQLQHMCLWDYANNYTMLGNWKGALDCFNILREESNWSRAVYAYSTAACLVEIAVDQPDKRESLIHEADKLMREVPKLTKKLAGKSLPIEKLVARKTRKFESQGKRLFLPGIELSYVFGSLGHVPRRALIDILIPRIDARLADLEGTNPETYGKGYWDDFCLGHFLRGVCKAMARYQPPEASEAARQVQEGDPSDEELDDGAKKDLLAAIRHSPDIELDHYISYHCHYELGRLYSRRGEKTSAQQHFDVVMSGKLTELNKHEQKASGKYSLEGALLMKTHSAIQALKDGNMAA